MTDLLINATGASRTSLGGQRYFGNIFSRLAWSGNVEFRRSGSGRFQRIGELVDRGRRDAIYWSPSHRGPLFAHNHVVTVFDCISLEYTYADDWRLPLLKASFAQLLKNAARVVCISEATKSAVHRHVDLPDAQVVAVPGPIYFPPKEPVAEQYTPERDYVLMICNALPHKNGLAAARAFSASSAAKRGIGLVIVGSINPQGIAACQDAGVTVEMMQGVSDQRLTRLIQQSRFLLSPSLSEGLNLPIAEALSLGANVLCSDIPVHREFYDGEAAFFAPRSHEMLVTALEEAFVRDGRWAREIRDKSQLTFDSVAQSYRRIFEELAAGLTPRQNSGERI